MFGTFQHSNLRIEVEASAEAIQACLSDPAQMKQWLWPQQFSFNSTELLTQGQSFTSMIGPIRLHHQVESLTDSSVRFLLHGAIDGFLLQRIQAL